MSGQSKGSPTGSPGGGHSTTSGNPVAVGVERPVVGIEVVRRAVAVAVRANCARIGALEDGVHTVVVVIRILEVRDRVPVRVLRRRLGATVIGVERVVQTVTVGVECEWRSVRDAVHVRVVAFDEVDDAVPVRILVDVVGAAIRIRIRTARRSVALHRVGDPIAITVDIAMVWNAVPVRVTCVRVHAAFGRRRNPVVVVVRVQVIGVPVTIGVDATRHVACAFDLVRDSIAIAVEQNRVGIQVVGCAIGVAVRTPDKHIRAFEGRAHAIPVVVRVAVVGCTIAVEIGQSRRNATGHVDVVGVVEPVLVVIHAKRREVRRAVAIRIVTFGRIRDAVVVGVRIEEIGGTVAIRIRASGRIGALVAIRDSIAVAVLIDVVGSTVAVAILTCRADPALIDVECVIEAVFIGIDAARNRFGLPIAISVEAFHAVE